MVIAAVDYLAQLCELERAVSAVFVFWLADVIESYREYSLNAAVRGGCYNLPRVEADLLEFHVVHFVGV